MKIRFIFFLSVIVLFVYTGSALSGSEVTSNTYYGLNAGAGLTTGINNSFFGANAGNGTTSGNNSTFLGYQAGYSNTTQSSNTFIGHIAGYNNTASNNAFLGYGAGFTNTTGFENTFMGYSAGYNNSTGFSNIFIGSEAGNSNTTGELNTFIGPTTGYTNTTGYENTFIGYSAGFSNDNGYYNTFIGSEAGNSNDTGLENTFIGYQAGYSNVSGAGNVFLGKYAGYNETGSDKLYIDNTSTSTPLIYGEFDNDILAIYGDVGFGMNNPSRVLDVYDAGDNARIAFHTDLTGAGVGNGSLIGPLQNGRFYLWNYENQDFWFGTNNQTRMIIKNNGYIGIGGISPGYPLHMASGARVTTGGVWTNASSRDYKENVQSLTSKEALNTLKDLNPVKFNYKVDKKESHVGFIAEDVPELVATGDRKGLSPMDIVAVLTKVLKEQQETISELKEQNKVIYMEVKEIKKEMKIKGSTASVRNKI